MTTLDPRPPLRRAHNSLTEAIACMDTDQEAALDDVIAARLLIATALLSLQQQSNFLQQESSCVG